MPAWVIPAIMAGSSLAGTAYSVYAGHKAQSDANKQAQQATDAQTGVQNQQLNLARQMLGLATPYAAQAGGYYSTLLKGSRPEMEAATAGPRGMILDTYRGAETAANRNLRGGAREMALDELGRDKTGAVAGLTTGVQPMAAQGLTGVASTLLGTGNSALGNAGLTGANLLNIANQNKWLQYGANQQSAASWGSLLANILGTLRNTTGGGMPRYNPNDAPGPAGDYA